MLPQSFPAEDRGFATAPPQQPTTRQCCGDIVPVRAGTRGLPAARPPSDNTVSR